VLDGWCMSAICLHRLGAVLCGLAALALAGPAAAARADCPRADAGPDEASERAIGSATVCLINRERARRRLRGLRVSQPLSRAALSHTRDMAERRYFAHASSVGPNLLQRVTLTGYLRRAARWRLGENLAWGMGSSATARDTVARWMTSRVHRRNILDRRFRDIGVGIVARPTGSAAAAAAYPTTFGYRR
jgi:uncharacterized protein YkwD